mmetsp:Transcript_12837/g.25350  ORF Transcript_12837/g.25350 Transcript_12837/m.25350 type:complete len:346 (+) Transcript_12837:282-1319(+)
MTAQGAPPPPTDICEEAAGSDGTCSGSRDDCRSETAGNTASSTKQDDALAGANRCEPVCCKAVGADTGGGITSGDITPSSPSAGFTGVTVPGVSEAGEGSGVASTEEVADDEVKDEKATRCGLHFFLVMTQIGSDCGDTEQSSSKMQPGRTECAMAAAPLLWLPLLRTGPSPGDRSREGEAAKGKGGGGEKPQPQKPNCCSRCCELLLLSLSTNRSSSSSSIVRMQVNDDVTTEEIAEFPFISVGIEEGSVACFKVSRTNTKRQTLATVEDDISLFSPHMYTIKSIAMKSTVTTATSDSWAANSRDSHDSRAFLMGGLEGLMDMLITPKKRTTINQAFAQTQTNC